MIYRSILLVSLVLFCSISLAVKEHYPFSNFPMYGNPSPNRVFFWLATSDGEPLPIKTLTDHSTAQFGKTVRAFIEQENKNNLPAESIVQLAGPKVMSYLRGKGTHLNQTLPAKMAIMETEITYQSGQILETPKIYFTE